MPEPSFGQLFHTQDGKTVFIDPKTNQATVFEGILTIDKIVEPTNSAVVAGKQEEAFMLLKSLLPPGFLKMDLVVLTGMPIDVDKDEAPDILGPKDYYILVPQEQAGHLKTGSCLITSWVSEFKNGHKPDYKGYIKHRILPEQWEWLKQHKDCPVVAWYSKECPVFVSLACQTHLKAIQPVIPQNKAEDGSASSAFVTTGDVISHQESVSGEEREI